MKIIAVKKVEDCLESTNVRDFILSKKITKQFIDYLAELGKLFYVKTFEKPFFKIIVRAKYTIKGAEGNKIIRILLPETASDKFINELISYIENETDS